MKIVFFGTGRFGIPALDRLLKDESHEVLAIVTGPDKKSGRGWQVRPTPVKAYLGLVSAAMPVLQPERLDDPDFLKQLKEARADLFVVIDYGKFLSRELLEMPRKYCVNLHPSLLPKYRGAAPVSRAILNGDTVTGNSVPLMNAEIEPKAQATGSPRLSTMMKLAERMPSPLNTSTVSARISRATRKFVPAKSAPNASTAMAR